MCHSDVQQHIPLGRNMKTIWHLITALKRTWMEIQISKYLCVSILYSPIGLSYTQTPEPGKSFEASSLSAHSDVFDASVDDTPACTGNWKLPCFHQEAARVILRWEPAGSSMWCLVISRQMDIEEATSQLLCAQNIASLFQNAVLIGVILKALFGMLLL